MGLFSRVREGLRRTAQQLIGRRVFEHRGGAVEPAHGDALDFALDAEAKMRDRLHLAEVMRTLKRSPAVLRVARVKP